jgi:hypothetical protein
MDRSTGIVGTLFRVGIAAALLVAANARVIAQDAGGSASDDDVKADDVKAKVREADRCIRGAEDGLVRALKERTRAAPDAAREASASIAKLLEATRGESRRASDAMQWILDNAPQ